MEFDIVPELLEKIKADYEKNISAVNSEDVLNQLIKSNNLDDAYAYARKIGQALSDAFSKNISSDILPNGRMYYNIANRLIPSTLTKAYKDSANISEIIMANINAQNKIGMAVQQGIMNADRITGIVDRLSEAEKFDDVKFLTGRAVIQNVTQSAVDDTIEANAQFQYKSGIRARVERKLGGKCCAWCQRLVGKYTYPNVPEDVYRRHENCRCTVIYYPSKTGKGQDVWSKKWTSKNSKKLNNNLASFNDNHQYYEPIKRSNETVNFDIHGKRDFSTNPIIGYNNFYAQEDLKISNRTVKNINNNLIDAARKIKLPIDDDLKVVLVKAGTLGKQGGALGQYDAVTNTLYFISDIGNKKYIIQLQDPNLKFGSTEFHEYWHKKQAKSYGKKITADNYDDYMNWLNVKCKSNIDKLGITEYNVDDISTYARMKYLSERFDEVEAEFYTKYNL